MRLLNTQKRENGEVLGGNGIIGARGALAWKILKRAKMAETFILKMYFILVKISHCRALNDQNCKNLPILGSNDVIGFFWVLAGNHYEKVKCCQNVYFENVLYSNQNLPL